MVKGSKGLPAFAALDLKQSQEQINWRPRAIHSESAEQSQVGEQGARLDRTFGRLNLSAFLLALQPIPQMVDSSSGRRSGSLLRRALVGDFLAEVET